MSAPALPAALPPLALFGVFVGGASAFGFAATSVVHRLSRGRLVEFRENLGAAFTASAGILAFLIALTSAAAMTAYLEVRTAVREEAGLLVTIYREAEVFAPRERAHVREVLRDYAERVVTEDWRELAEGRPVSAESFERASNAAQDIIRLEPAGPLQMGVKTPMLQAVAEAMRHARTRARAAEPGVPAVFWFVAIFGGALVIGLSSLVETKSHRADLVRVGTFAVMIGLLLFLIAILGRPFDPVSGISPEPFVKARANMEELGL
jgi:hypothetical protein